jgi:hypothetical protein
VGALGHFLEAEGIPTTQISLIREHTETIKPPRALCVPFDLGRPLGRPLDTVLQRRVLLAALDLFKAPRGPVLADFPYPGTNTTGTEDPEPALWACPVSFTAPSKDISDNKKLIAAFEQELAELMSWYDLERTETGRTSVVDFGPDAAAELLSAYVLNGTTHSSKSNLPFAVALRLAAQDLKAFYFEAIAARPGATPPNSTAFKHWFWVETVAGQVLKAVKARCLNEADKSLRMTGAMLLVPLGQS